MKNIFAKYYQPLPYLFFRLFYTTTHLLAFLLLKDRRSSQNIKQKSYILIVGIEPESRYFTEKLFQFVQQCRQVYPGKKIVLLSKAKNWNDYNRYLPVITVPWEYQNRARLLTPLYRFLYGKAPVFSEDAIREYAEQAAFMVDLGYYQWDSTKVTGWTANMLTNIVFAKRFGLHYFMFPQSVSPFSYPFPVSIPLRLMLRYLPSYAEELCIRESWGIDAFKKISRGNVSHCLDYLFYGEDFTDPEGQGGLARDALVFVPDQELIRNQGTLINILERLGNNYAHHFSELIIFVYDGIYAGTEQDDLLAIRHQISPSWTVEIASRDRDVKTIIQTRKDIAVVTSHYHALIHAILRPLPVVVMVDDPVLRSLVEDFRLESRSLTCKDIIMWSDDQLNGFMTDFIKSKQESIRELPLRHAELVKQRPLKFFNDFGSTG